MTYRIAVLALQGDFAEHESALRQCGVEVMEIRQRADLQKTFDALVLPGGESTVIGKLLRELELFSPLQERLQAGLPVFATCAGLILLADQIENDSFTYFRTLDVTVRRNAYGRQLGSFHTEGNFAEMSRVPMSFIRAPSIESVGTGVTVLSEYNGKPTAVMQGNQVALAWHPELLSDHRVLTWFLERSAAAGKNR
ncbi:MAG: pyridoxal 5'-phosphate synthase glutaminase subunit PdxT [Thermoguttaceae bacterium]|nr:pyridoxal 5'-phosphate synthase glutaminase subunit PdxT [Thermoguttaceae bacterium]